MVTPARSSDVPVRDPNHDILFEPVKIGPKVLRNRFYQVPHCTGFGSEKPQAQAHHRAVKAEGGWAAVCTEYAPISPDADAQPFNSARVWDDQDARSLSLMCEAAHEHGALAGIQLSHGGAYAANRESRLPSLAPSQVANDLMPRGTVPKAMDRADIKRVTEDWVSAARRARDVGFDLIYVYGGHSVLLLQFLSPLRNRRTDQYGGSLQNRARLYLETLERVRQAVGDDCAIVNRFAVDALGPWGVGLEEGLEFVALADHLVDLWDITIGAGSGSARVDSGTSRFYPEGHQLEWTTHVRAATSKPIVGTGRFTNPDTMAAAIRSGQLDLIGAARPSIADPFLPKKIEQGRYDDICECIGCNFCYSRANYHLQVGCTQNATAGEEFRRGWHPERFTRAANADREVLIVGAGPAGLECAIVLGKRGFQHVDIVEADDEIGGNLRWIPKLPGLDAWERVLHWRQTQLDRLPNVDVVTGARLNAQEVLDCATDIVIIATGSHWATDGLNGFTCQTIPGADASQPWVLTPEQIMLQAKRPPGKRAIVYDCDGYFLGSSLAELLALEGYHVTLTTPYEQVAPLSFETLEADRIWRRMHELGISLATATTLTALEPDHTLGHDPLGSPIRLEADAIVLVTQRASNEMLYTELTAEHPASRRTTGVEAVYRIGDCVSPRLLGDVIYDGHRLAREIDTPNPSVALPYRRERPSDGAATTAPALQRQRWM
jgi:dimethylamine/trimethylamine dehydrogenase